MARRSPRDIALDHFMEATCDIVAGDYAAAAKRLRAAVRVCGQSDGDLRADLTTLLESCEAKA